MAAVDPNQPVRSRYRYQRPVTLLAAVAGLLGLFALVGLAASAESVDDYRDRQLAGQGDRNGQSDQSDSNQQDRSDPADSNGSESSGPDDSSPPDPDSSGQPTQLQPDDNGRYFYPDEDRQVDGLRVTEDGQLVAVELRDLRPGDIPIGSDNNGGLSIYDDETGVRVELLNNGDGIDGRSSTPGAGYAPLRRTDDGSVVALPSDGFTAEQLAGADGDPVVLNPEAGPISVAFTEDGLVAAPLPEDAVIINDALDRVFAGSQTLPWRWVFLAYCALALASLTGAYLMHRRRPRHVLDLGPFSSEPEQVDRFEQLLRSLADDTDPTHAVCVAFSVAERGLGRLAPRRSEETPSEWYHRLLAEAGRAVDGPPSAGSGTGLAERLGPVCDLYARARFAPGQASPADQQAMVAALRELHSAATGQSSAPPIFAGAPLAGSSPGSVDR